MQLLFMSDLCRTDFAVNYGDAVGGVLAFGILSGLWLRMLDGVLQPGFLRAFAVLPVVAGNLIAPKLFCRGLDAITVILVAFNTMWLCSFKVTAFVFVLTLNQLAELVVFSTPPAR